MDTMKDTTMQLVTDVVIVPEATAEFIAGLIARIEQLESDLATAEKERDIDGQRIADLMKGLNRAGHENDALRTKIKVMEQQEPVGWVDGGDLRALSNGNSVWLNPDDQGRMVPVYLAAAPKPEAKP